MIVEVRAKNCYAFEDAITFSMKADMRNKKFGGMRHDCRGESEKLLRI